MHIPLRFRFPVAVVLLSAACSPSVGNQAYGPLPPASELVAVDPATVGMSAALQPALDSILRAAVADSAAPGAALAVGRYGRLVHVQGYGRTDWREDAPEVTEGTLWDLASLTKVVGTTTAAMILEEEGRLALDRTVASYLPEFNDPAKAAITLRQLLEHRGGLEAFAPLYREFRGREQYLEQINRRPSKRAPGTETEYSDWDLILLQLIIERITAQPLDHFLQERLFRPLGMHDTGFNPDPSLKPRIAATEIQEWRGGKVHGEVHDENAWALGGVAGHAGLFSSARDLAIFAQMLLNGGSYGGVRILRPETIARWTARQNAGSSRALGWDTPSPGSSAGQYMSPNSFGHTGFTGTSIWIDPRRDLFVILLSNRVNPTRENRKIFPVRRAVADEVQEAVIDAPLINWEEQMKPN
jgi:CubicO group peptidase (beta-lactamase class C family)